MAETVTVPAAPRRQGQRLAARSAALACAGEILIPEPVRHLLAGKDFLFSDRGDVALKGFEDPVRLYEVRWREAT